MCVVLWDCGLFCDLAIYAQKACYCGGKAAGVSYDGGSSGTLQPVSGELSEPVRGAKPDIGIYPVCVCIGFPGICGD